MYGEEYGGMMMLEDRFFDQEWVQELGNEDFRMLLYLLHFASKKTGIVELNMRQINFSANTGKMYSKEDVLSKFGNMIKIIPGKENTAIFPDYIATNWAKNGKPIDTVRNPLFKSVVAELGSFGLTIDDVNALAKKKVAVMEEQSPIVVKRDEMVGGSSKTTASVQSTNDADVVRMFDAFWVAYPGPRKTDKKKCLDRFGKIIRASKDPVKLFNRILQGLDDWKATDDWMKNGGQFICAPLVWLNNERWDAEIRKGSGYGNSKGSGSANSNYKSSGAEGIF